MRLSVQEELWTKEKEVFIDSTTANRRRILKERAQGAEEKVRVLKTSRAFVDKKSVCLAGVVRSTVSHSSKRLLARAMRVIRVQLRRLPIE